MHGIDFYKISGFVSLLSNSVLALFVLIKNPKRQLNRTFAFFSFAIAFWSVGSALVNVISDPAIALLALRSSYLAGVFVPSLFFHFVLSFTAEQEKHRVGMLFAYILSLALALNVYSDSFIKQFRVLPAYGYRIDVVGSTYLFFAIFFVIVVFGSLMFLVGKYQIAKEKQRYQLRFLFLGYFFGAFAGVEYFLSVYQILPRPPIDDYLLVLTFVSMAYGITRHRLMDIEVIIRRTIVFAGLFAMVMAVVSGVSVVVREIAEHFVKVPDLLSNLLTVGLAVSLYNPTRARLLDLTDRYLFQKKALYYRLLRENSKQIAMIHSLDEIARQVTAFLVKQGRIRNAALFIFNDEAREYRLYYPLGYGGREKRPRVTLSENDPVVESLKVGRTAVTREEIEKQRRLKTTGAEDQALCSRILSTMKSLKAEVLIPSFLGVLSAEGKPTNEQRLRSILVLGAKKSDQDYTEEDLSVFFTIAQESAIAAEKARLFDVLLQEREEKVQAQADAKMVTCARSIAHETKNALNAIYSPADFMTLYGPEDLQMFVKRYAPAAENDPDAQRSLGKLLTKMKDKGATLRQKAEEIRIVTKTAEGALTSDCVEFQQFSFKVIWDGAVAEVQARYPEVKLYRDLPLPYPYGNVVLLQRVLTNLFMNAAEAGIEKEGFEVVTRGEYKEMDGKMGTLFEVQDNGAGIAAPILEKIFLQGFSTKPKPKPHERDASGYGQGLWVCRQTIEEIHKGKIWVESEVGKGTRFFIWLPFGEGCIKL